MKLGLTWDSCVRWPQRPIQESGQASTWWVISFISAPHDCADSIKLNGQSDKFVVLLRRSSASCEECVWVQWDRGSCAWEPQRLSWSPSSRSRASQTSPEEHLHNKVVANDSTNSSTDVREIKLKYQRAKFIFTVSHDNLLQQDSWKWIENVSSSDNILNFLTSFISCCL